MKADFFYKQPFGRTLLKIIQRLRLLKLAALFVKSPISKPLIKPFIKKYGIDMKPFEGQKYKSYADFFARYKPLEHYENDPNVLISPCDSLLSIFPISDDLELSMKGSCYKISDLIREDETARLFSDGLCLVFRLEASDYHHFCHFDDCRHLKTEFIPGLLHSVQPIACRTVPVYRLNRRWFTLLETKNFGTAAQIEIGALLVGGVSHINANGWLGRGTEMGNFELAGSTIVLLLSSEVRQSLKLYPKFQLAWNGKKEIRTKMGEGVGYNYRKI